MSARYKQRSTRWLPPSQTDIESYDKQNLSKVFGELMMLIEPDKRGKEHAISLAYSQDADEKFYVPGNLHLIGMMNTACQLLQRVRHPQRCPGAMIVRNKTKCTGRVALSSRGHTRQQHSQRTQQE